MQFENFSGLSSCVFCAKNSAFLWATRLLKIGNGSKRIRFWKPLPTVKNLWFTRYGERRNISNRKWTFRCVKLSMLFLHPSGFHHYEEKQQTTYILAHLPSLRNDFCGLSGNVLCTQWNECLGAFGECFCTCNHVRILSIVNHSTGIQKIYHDKKNSDADSNGNEKFCI